MKGIIMKGLAQQSIFWYLVPHSIGVLDEAPLTITSLNGIILLTSTA